MYRRFITGALALILFIQPLTPALAQEAASSETGSETTNNEAVAATDQAAPIEQPIEPIQAPEAALPAPGNSQQSQAANNSTGDTGTKQVTLETISDFDGSFQNDYPLTVPPGRNGLHPDLSLSYNSSGGSDHDQFGYGWSIDIPYIQRINKYGVEHLYTGTSSFYSSLSGELVQVGTSNQYRAKVETGDFYLYTLTNNTWSATGKDGRTLTFGSSTTARQDNSASSSQVYKWMVEKVADPNGNSIDYTYFKDETVLYPDEITYTNHTSGDGIFKLEFNRENKATSTSDYAPAFKQTTADRISEILVLVNDSWVTKYELGYTAGDNTYRDLLASITVTGRTEDGTGTTSLPDTEFNYQQTTRQTAVTPHTNFSNSIPGYFYDDTASIYDQGYRLAEINCDGLTDIVHADGGPRSQGKIYLNDGDEWKLSSSSFDGLVNFSDLDFRFGAVRMLDVDGDGCTDVVGSYLPNGGIALEHVYLNTGTGGWTYSSSYSNSIPEYFIEVTGSGYVDNGYQFADVNGDGLVDLVHDANPGTGGADREVYLNDGTQWVENTNWNTPDAEDLVFTKLIARLVDVNNDRRADIVHSAKQTSNSYKKVYLNNGTGGWVEDAAWSKSLPDYFVDDNLTDTDLGYRYVDINNDGLIDIAHKDEIHLNTGNGWNATTSWVFPTDSEFELTDQTSFLVDVDGDGQIDLVRSELDSSFGYEDVFLNAGLKADLLASSTNPRGGEITISYQGSAELGDTNGNRHNPDLPGVRQVVSEVAYDNAFGQSWSDTYSYQAGDFYYNADDVRDRRFAGFGKVTKTTDLYKTITYVHQANGSTTTVQEGDDGEYLIGFPFRTDTLDLSDNLYLVNRFNYATTSLGDDSVFVRLESTVDLSYDGDADKKAAATGFVFATSNGALLTQTEYGEVSGNLDGSFTDTGTDKRTFTNTYATTTGLVLPASVTLTNHAGTKITELQNYYDGQPLGSATLGNLTAESVWIDGNTYATTTHEHNIYGLVATTTDPLGNAATVVYDSHNLYPATTTNALGHETGTVFDLSSGLLLVETNANGNNFSSVLDGIDRPTKEYIPDPQTGSKVQKTAITYTDTRAAARIYRDDILAASNQVSFITYLDGFGQPIQTRAEAESGFIVSDIWYNSAGLVAQESLPYESTGAARTTATADTDLLTSNDYDPLKRILTMVTVLGTTTRSYDQWEETITDPLDNVKDLVSDAFKRLASVVEYIDGSSYTTNYDYRADDLLIGVTDADNNERAIGYDGRGLRTSLEDLHDPSDTSFGTWSFVYDLAGNLGTTTDPEGQSIVATHDVTNRVLTEQLAGDPDTLVTFGYDNCTEGVGFLCSASSTEVRTDLDYTFTGLVAEETKIIGTDSYTTATEYNRQGDETLITHPDDSEVRNSYNTRGLLDKIEWRESGGSFSDVITNLDYAPHGLVAYLGHANGLETVRTYNEDKRYQLESIVTATSTGTGGAGAEHAAIEFALSQSALDEPTEDEYFTNSASTPVVADTDPEEDAASAPADADTASSTPTEEAVTEPVSTASSSDELLVTPKAATSTAQEPSAGAANLRQDDEDKTDHQDTGRYTDTGSEYELSLSPDATVKVAKDRTEVTLSQPNNGINLAVSYPDIKASGDYDAKDNKIKWQDGTTELHAYELDPDQTMEDGGFEIEVVLNEPTTDNVFTFDLSGDRDLNFFYQPPLSAEAAEDHTCTETQCVDAVGEITAERPENIVGSYAVYRGEQKVFHVFRPKIYDAKGNTVWGELSYEPGELSVTVPTDFLNKASYPVIVDPTFGYTSVPGSNISIGSSDFRGSLFTSPSDYSSFTDMVIYCDTSFGTYSIKGLIVEHSSLNIVSNGVSDSESCSTTAGWKTLTFGSSPSLSASTEYLLGAVAGASRPRLYYDSGSTNQGHQDTSNSFSIPQDLGSASHNNHKYGVYVTYSAGGGGNTAPIAPTDLEAEGSTNPTNITDSTPEFTAIYNDPDSGDLAVNYEIKVDDNSNFASPIWDSGKTTLATTTAGNRTASISYGGTALASSTTYYWRVKFWDDDDAVGTWSTSTATFSLAAGPNATPTAPTSLLTEGQTNPTDISDPTPEFSALYNDPDTSDNALYYRLEVDDDSGFGSPIWNSGKTSLATTSEGNRSPDITYGGSALASSTTYYWRIKFWDDEDAEGAWSAVTATFDLGEPTPNATPTAPTLLETEGQTNPTDITDPTPEFTAIYNDPNAGDQAVFYQLQVATTTDFASTTWDSGQTALATTTQGNRTGDITYSGNTLASSTTYFWRVKFWDDSGAEGLWSTSTASFSLKTPPVPAGPAPILSLHFNNDAVGNPTQIVDLSAGYGPATTTLIYDGGYRLATSTQVGGLSPYTRAFLIDGIGNIDYNSHLGAYLYQGDTGSNYANPHAVTDIDGDPLTYDKNGNLLTYLGTTNTWNHFNRLLSSVLSNSTSSFAYDHTGQRALKTVETAGGGGGSGSEEFSDAFTESSDIALDNHTPNVGGGWTHLINVGSCDLEIDASDGELSAAVSSCGASDGGLYRTDSQATHADVELSVLQVDGDSSDDTNIMACRVQDANNMYAVEWNEDDSTLHKRVSGTWTELDSNTDDIANNSTVTLICDGSSISFEDDGVELLSATDSSITSAGYGGLGMGAVITSGHDVSSQDLDDFTMTTLSGSGGSSGTTTTTHYPTAGYKVTGSDITKHIYADNELVASINGSGGSASVEHVHVDHLGSTRVVTDENKSTTQLLAYYPFGAEHTDTQYGSFNQTNRFTGHDYDDETSLTYMGARYYNGVLGRFSSQDPVSLALGDWEQAQLHAAVPLSEWLRNPQRFNTYAYAGNNPIKNVDMNGKDYYEVGGDGTFFGYGVTFSAKYDPERGRLDIGGGAGLSAGLGGSITGGYNFGDLPNAHGYASQDITAFACVAAICGKGSVGNTVVEPLSNNIDISVDGGIYGGVGLGGAVQPSGSLNTTVFDNSQNYNILTDIAASLKGIVDTLRKLKEKSKDDE